MLKTLMSKSNKEIYDTKNYLNLTSYITPHSSQKGITLMSLIIYITIMFVVLAIIMRVTTYFTKNLNDAADTTFEEEFEKFNMYMLQETKKTGNYVTEISEDGTSVTFSDGNKFEFIKKDGNEIGEIHFNEIKICENVSACTFSSAANEETGKTEITVNLTVNGTVKLIQYVITNSLSIEQSTLTERNYIIEKINKHGIPIDYQEVEYIKSTGSQYIQTDIIPTDNMGIYAKVLSTNISSDLIYFGSRGSENSRFWIGNTSSKLYFGWNTTTTASNRPIISNEDINEIKMNYLNDRKHILNNQEIDNNIGTLASNTYPLTIFAGNELGTINYKSSILLYDLIVSEGNIIKYHFIPCHCKTTVINVDGDEYPSGTIGLYDLVNGKFYTKSGTGEFIKGPNVD